MEGPEQKRLIDQAERAIASILAQLEIETGMLVNHITVISDEITNKSDSRREYAQRVEIEMYSLPGHTW